MVSLKQFFALVNNQFNISIKNLTSNNGGEFFNDHLSSFLEKKVLFTSAVARKPPQPNSRVELKHRHLLEVSRSLKLHVSIDDIIFGDWILVVCYIINRTPLFV